MLLLITFFTLSVVLLKLTRYFYFKNKWYVIRCEYDGIKYYYTTGKQTKGDTWLKNKFRCPCFTHKEGCLQIQYLEKIFPSDYFTLERVFWK